MWHVAEGDLHAYLDGALSAYPAEEAERIREHLERCGECRTRLREEEQLRERAGGILARTEVGVGEPPPFEEIRQRALVRSSQQGRSRPSWIGTRLGWAASVALALGTGWMLGHAPGATTSGRLVEPDVSSERAAGPRASPEPAPLAEAERQDAAETAFADAVPPGAQDSRSGELVATASRPPGEAPAEKNLEQETLAAAAEVAASAPPARTLDDVRAGLGERELALREERSADEISAPALPADLLLPGLRVLDVRWGELTPGVEGLFVRQRLAEDTTVLELRFLGLDGGIAIPTGEPSDLLGSLPEEVNQVVGPFGEEGGWVALRGRLPQERLARLLDLLR